MARGPYSGGNTLRGSATRTSTPLTMAIRANLDAHGGNTHVLCSQGNSASSTAAFRNCFMIALSSTAASGAIAVTGSGAANVFASAGTTFPTDTWTGVVATFTSATRRDIYQTNISTTGSNTTSQTPTGINRTAVGTRDDAATNQFPFNGLLADHAIWDVVLTSAEISQYMAGVSPLQIRPNNLVGYWPLLGRYSPEIDLVGGNHLSVQGTVNPADHPRVYFPRGNKWAYLKPAVNHYLLLGDYGDFSLDGTASISRDYTLGGGYGDYILTGFDADLITIRQLIAEHGDYVLSGQDVSFARHYILRSNPGSIVARFDNAALWRLIQNVANNYTEVAGSSNSWTEVPGGTNDWDDIDG